MKSKIIILLLLLASLGSNAQVERIIELSGIVYGDTLQPLPFVNVFIKNQNKGTITNFDGSFNMYVRPNDQIIVSSVGFKKSYFTIPDSVSTPSYVFDVYLDADTFELEMASVFPWKTYEQFKQAVINYKHEDVNLENARKNIEQMIAEAQSPENMSMGAYENYRFFMNQIANKAYYAGQQMPNNFLNPFAWKRYIDILNKNKERKKNKSK